MKVARVGDTFEDDKQGEIFKVIESNDKGFTVECIKEGRWMTGETYTYEPKEIDLWFRNWNYKPNKEDRIKELLNKIDNDREREKTPTGE